MPEAGTQWSALASTLRNQKRHAVGAKLAGKLASTQTTWLASYLWTNEMSLTAVDMFSSSPGHMDPYLNLFIRQPLPDSPLLPGRMEALIDVRNLLAQGYVPVIGQDGQTLYLVQTARAIRGGVAFTF
jgi:hypothetical protein